MKYFIYTRKSTESAERQVMSLESQLSELKEFAASPSYKTTEEQDKEKLEIALPAPVQGEAGGRGVGRNSARRAQPVPFGYFQTDTAS